MNASTFASLLLQRRITAVEVDDVAGDAENSFHLKAIVLATGVRVEFRGEHGFSSDAVCTVVLTGKQGS